MNEKILWRTPQIKSTIVFFLISPWWLYLMYCFSFSQSIFSLSAFKVVTFNYWFLFLSSLVISLLLYSLWFGAVFLATIHALMTFYFSSIFLLATTNKLFLSFNIIFFVASGLNILFWIRDASMSCYQKKHYKKGFFGKILKTINGELMYPQNTNPLSQEVVHLTFELVDWDEHSMRVRLTNFENKIEFSSDQDFALKIFFQGREFSLKVHSTIWSEGNKILGLRVVKQESQNLNFGTDYDSFINLTYKLGQEASLLY